ncbi:MAG: diadenylate cyclase CdaA [Chloroflexota bacterium]|nr:diadenylate cyclase CdaA [Chloroflexota bacterium]
METPRVELIWLLENLTPQAIIDIFLVAMLFFCVSFFIRGTQAVTLLRGTLIVIGVAAVVANVFNLMALRWLIETLLPIMAIALPVIFQPELRRALERLGRAGVNANRQPADLRARIIEDVCQAAERLSERKHGALIVLERKSSLQDYIRTGVPLDSEVSPQLLLTVFWPKTELHDGAAIIDWQGRVAAAAAVLPLSSSRTLTTPKLGTRHRAALGITEVSDAVCVIVSEETGRISITNAGRLIPRLDSKRLRTILTAFYGVDATSTTLGARLRDGVRTLSARLSQQNNG